MFLSQITEYNRLKYYIRNKYLTLSSFIWNTLCYFVLYNSINGIIKIG